MDEVELDRVGGFERFVAFSQRALDIDEVVPESAGGSLRFAVRAKLEKA